MPTTTKIDDDAPAGNLVRPWTITASVAKSEVGTAADDGIDAEDVSANLRERKKVSRERGRWELRAKLRGISVNARTRGCGARCVSEQGAGIEVRQLAGGAKARWVRILRCGHVWTCPCCASDIRAKRRKQVVLAVKTGKIHPWRMLTLTVRHHAGGALKPLIDGLMRAWRKTRQQGAVQRVWKRHVTASIRAVEVTHGANGWHPHLHVLINSEAWADEDYAMLSAIWKRIVVAELGAAHVPDSDVGVKWSLPVRSANDASYLSKLGLEMSWGEKRVHTQKSRSAWTIARDATNGDEPSQHLWREYEQATKGRRALELDDRAAKLAKQGAEAEAAESIDPAFDKCAACGHSAAEHFTIAKAQHPPLVDTPALCCGRDRRKKCACEGFVAPEKHADVAVSVEVIHVESHAVWILRRCEPILPGIMWHLLRAIEDRPKEAQAVFDTWVHWAGRQFADRPIYN